MYLRQLIRNQPVKLIESFILFLVWICLGLNVAIPGPTLLDLQDMLGTSLEEISLILPSRSGGYALGAVISKSLAKLIEQDTFQLH